MINAEELHVGIVLWLDSEALEAFGGQVCKPGVTNPSKVRPWVIVREVGPGEYWLLPLFGQGSWSRIPFPMKGRTGHSKWLNNPNYYDPEMTWRAPAEAITVAASCAGDTSKTWLRNEIDPRFLPDYYTP